MPSIGPDIALLEMDKPVPNEAKFCSICLPASNNFPDTPLHGEVFCLFFNWSSLKLFRFKESVEGSLTRCGEKEGTGHLGSAVSYQL